MSNRTLWKQALTTRWVWIRSLKIGAVVGALQVLIHQGDVVFAEVDGVVIIPQDVAEETMSRAFEKVAKEDGAREDHRGDGGALRRPERAADGVRLHGEGEGFLQPG